MTEMLPEIAQLEPRFKEILYRCLEEVQATKAALYLLNGESQYSLVTQYGFGDNLRKVVGPTDPVPDRLLIRRAPFFVNGLMDEPRFSEMMFATHTERMLAAPIYARGKLVGFIDMRDKSGKRPFQMDDIGVAQKIVEQMLSLFAEKQLYGQQSMQISKVESQVDPNDQHFAASTKVVELAKAIASKHLVPGEAINTMSMGEGELASVAAALPPILFLPGAVMAAFSVFGPSGGQEIVAVGAVSDAALKSFEDKLKGWVRRRGEPDSLGRTRVSYPFGPEGTTVAPERIHTVLSAPVSNRKGMVLSIVFESSPDNETRAKLETFLKVVDHAVQQATSTSAVRMANQRIAEHLLEPDFTRYPQLLNHSKRVASLAEHLALKVGLNPTEIETVRLAALVHDAGMRLLDYDRLYRKRDITDAEMKLLQEHPVVSAALAWEAGLGAEIAQIVLTHHERVDGRGYPNGLHGNQIPAGARILHICEAFDSMTASDSYQTPLTEGEALQRIQQGSGTQFDVNYAKAFQQMLMQVPHA